MRAATYRVALYDTRGGPWANDSWGGSTYRKRTIHVHFLQPPLNGLICLAALPHPITAARLLHGDAPVTFTQTDAAIISGLGATTYQAPVTILELTTAEPVAPFQSLGSAADEFDDESAAAAARQSTAVTTVSSGTITKDADHRLTLKTGVEKNPSLTLDLGEGQEVTAFSAVQIDFSAHNRNSELIPELSLDGQTWEKPTMATTASPNGRFYSPASSPASNNPVFLPASCASRAISAPAPAASSAAKSSSSHVKLTFTFRTPELHSIVGIYILNHDLKNEYPLSFKK